MKPYSLLSPKQSHDHMNNQTKAIGKMNSNPRAMITMAFALVVLVFSHQAARANLLGADGGFEGSATVDNTTIAPAGAAGVWQKANATQTIAVETSAGIVRSGGKCLRALTTSTTGRRIYSPWLSSVPDGSSLVLQLDRRKPTGTGQEAQRMLQLGTTAGEKHSGTYGSASSADTWEKVTYAPSSGNSTTSGNKWAGVLQRLATGGNNALYEYYDDVAVYVGTGADAVSPNAASSPSVGSATAGLRPPYTGNLKRKTTETIGNRLIKSGMTSGGQSVGLEFFRR